MQDIFGEGTKRQGLQFPKVGTEYTLVIEDMEQEPQVDLSTGETKTWPDGKPKMQIVIKGTSAGEPFTKRWNKDLMEWVEVEDDDNVRYLFCAGGIFTAVKKARAAYGKTLKQGDKIHIKFTGVGKASQAGWNPPKQFEAKIIEGVSDPFAV